MKKQLLIFILLTFPFVCSAQFTDYYSNIALGLGVSQSSSEKGSSSNFQLEGFIIFSNFYLDFGTNFEESEEKQYGSGGISDKHRLTNFNIGYSLHPFNKHIFLIPLLGIGRNETLYNDKYYDDDVALSKSAYTIGISAGLRIKSIVCLLKLTTEQKGLFIGVTL
jgi:hypothetical protein